MRRLRWAPGVRRPRGAARAAAAGRERHSRLDHRLGRVPSPPTATASACEGLARRGGGAERRARRTSTSRWCAEAAGRRQRPGGGGGGGGAGGISAGILRVGGTLDGASLESSSAIPAGAALGPAEALAPRRPARAPARTSLIGSSGIDGVAEGVLVLRTELGCARRTARRALGLVLGLRGLPLPRVRRARRARGRLLRAVFVMARAAARDQGTVVFMWARSDVMSSWRPSLKKRRELRARPSIPRRRDARCRRRCSSRSSASGTG